MKEALLYDRSEGGAIRCRLCRHGCRIAEGKTGICRVRLNRAGTLYSLVYDKVVSVNVDPIEKKPLFHVAPGSRSFSIATAGCNFRCDYCQNHAISQMPRDQGTLMGDAISPEEIAAAAARHKCRTIAYTYTEPTIFYELARDTMEAAHSHGVMNVFVTNGYMTRDALDDAKGLLDAANVDLKAFSDRFYLKRCKARLKGVLDSLAYMKQLGIWVEVTTLLIPGLNDDPAELRALARFLRSDLGPETPWHVSRFYPNYKTRDIPPTEAAFLRTVRQMGLDEGLSYVYTGNISWEMGEQTQCPVCSHLLIRRAGYTIVSNCISEGRCPKCGHKVEGLEL